MSNHQSSLLEQSGVPRLIRDLSTPLGAQGEVPLSEAGIAERDLSRTFEPPQVDADGIKPL